MTPQKLSLDPFTEGDVWDGIPAIIIKIGPEGGPYAAPEHPMASATMRFSKRDNKNSPIIELSHLNSEELIFTDADGWELSIPKQVVPGVTCGDWDWQIRIVDTQGNPYTYLGDTITVLRKI